MSALGHQVSSEHTLAVQLLYTPELPLCPSQMHTVLEVSCVSAESTGLG